MNPFYFLVQYNQICYILQLFQRETGPAERYNLSSVPLVCSLTVPQLDMHQTGALWKQRSRGFFSHSYLWSHSFSLEFMTIVEGWILDWLENQENHCRHRPNPPVNLLQHSTLTCKQDPETFEHLYLGVVAPHCHRFGSVNPHPSLFRLSCKPSQSELQVTVQCCH